MCPSQRKGVKWLPANHDLRRAQGKARLALALEGHYSGSTTITWKKCEMPVRKWNFHSSK